MSYKRVKASKHTGTGRCTDTHGHLYVGILSIDIGFGEVGEVVQIEEESSRAVPMYVAALCPGEGGRPVGQPVFWTRPPVFRSQLGRGAAFCIYIVLLRRERNIILIYYCLCINNIRLVKYFFRKFLPVRALSFGIYKVCTLSNIRLMLTEVHVAITSFIYSVDSGHRAQKEGAPETVGKTLSAMRLSASTKI